MHLIFFSRETSVLNIYNLHKAYEAASVSTRLYTAPPWLALDTHVLTPFHKKHKKIPGTFPMKNRKYSVIKYHYHIVKTAGECWKVILQ